MNHWIRRKLLLLTRLMLILNNLIRLLILSIVVAVLILKLNSHSITKETLISHKKLLLKKSIYKTHKMIFIPTVKLTVTSHQNKPSIKPNKKICIVNINLTIKASNNVSDKRNLTFNVIFINSKSQITFFSEYSRNWDILNNDIFKLWNGHFLIKFFHSFTILLSILDIS